MTKSINELLNMIHVYIVFNVLYVQDINIVQYFYMYDICCCRNFRSQNKYRFWCTKISIDVYLLSYKQLKT